MEVKVYKKREEHWKRKGKKIKEIRRKNIEKRE